jgi:hypothetical protein
LRRLSDFAVILKRFTWLLFSAALILPISGKAYSALLCGEHYSNRGDLERTLHSKGGRVFNGEGVRTVFASSKTRLSLWWLTSTTSRAYPAIVCVEKIQTADGTLKRHKAEADCQGAEQPACQRLRGEIAKAKF